jgi:hypothetical protein
MTIAFSVHESGQKRAVKARSGLTIHRERSTSDG